MKFIFIIMTAFLISQANVIDVSKYGILPNDNIPDSDRINKLIKKFKYKKGTYVFQFQKGVYNIDKELKINRSFTTIKGAGDKETIFLSNIKSKFMNKSIINIDGYIGSKKGILVQVNFFKNEKDKKVIYIELNNDLYYNKLLKIRNFDIHLNQKNFKNQIKRELKSDWLKETPFIYQELNTIDFCKKEFVKAGSKRKVLKCNLENTLKHNYSSKMRTQGSIYFAKNISDITIDNLTIKGDSNHFNKKESKVNGLSTNFVRSSNFTNLKFESIFQNPIDLNQAYNLFLENVTVTEPLNREELLGSINVFRTYDSVFRNFNLSNINYFLVSWSSAYNNFSHFTMNRPLFLRGGHTRKNKFEHFNITIQENSKEQAYYDNISNQTKDIVPNKPDSNKIDIFTFKINDLRPIKF